MKAKARSRRLFIRNAILFLTLAAGRTTPAEPSAGSRPPLGVDVSPYSSEVLVTEDATPNELAGHRDTLRDPEAPPSGAELTAIGVRPVPLVVKTADGRNAGESAPAAPSRGGTRAEDRPISGDPATLARDAQRSGRRPAADRAATGAVSGLMGSDGAGVVTVGRRRAGAALGAAARLAASAGGLPPLASDDPAAPRKIRSVNAGADDAERPSPSSTEGAWLGLERAIEDGRVRAAFPPARWQIPESDDAPKAGGRDLVALSRARALLAPADLGDSPPRAGSVPVSRERSGALVAASFPARRVRPLSQPRGPVSVPPHGPRYALALALLVALLTVSAFDLRGNPPRMAPNLRGKAFSRRGER